jgi:hypothetical protein
MLTEAERDRRGISSKLVRWKKENWRGVFCSERVTSLRLRVVFGIVMESGAKASHTTAEKQNRAYTLLRAAGQRSWPVLAYRCASRLLVASPPSLSFSSQTPPPTTTNSLRRLQKQLFFVCFCCFPPHRPSVVTFC